MFTGYLRSPPGRRADVVATVAVYKDSLHAVAPQRDVGRWPTDPRRLLSGLGSCGIVGRRSLEVTSHPVQSSRVARCGMGLSRGLLAGLHIDLWCRSRRTCVDRAVRLLLAIAFRRIISSVRGTASRMANQRAEGGWVGRGSVAGARRWCWSGRQRRLARPGPARVAIDWSEARSGREVRRRRRWLRDLSLSTAAAAAACWCCCIQHYVTTWCRVSLASNHCQSVIDSAAVQCQMATLSFKSTKITFRCSYTSCRWAAGSRVPSHITYWSRLHNCHTFDTRLRNKNNNIACQWRQTAITILLVWLYSSHLGAEKETELIFIG